MLTYGLGCVMEPKPRCNPQGNENLGCTGFRVADRGQPNSTQAAAAVNATAPISPMDASASKRWPRASATDQPTHPHPATDIPRSHHALRAPVIIAIPRPVSGSDPSGTALRGTPWADRVHPDRLVALIRPGMKHGSSDLHGPGLGESRLGSGATRVPPLACARAPIGPATVHGPAR